MEADDFAEYIGLYSIHDEFITYKNMNYKLTQMRPGGEARFHRPGQTAHYLASGQGTARAEVGPAKLKESAAFVIPAGERRFLNMVGYLDAHPERRAIFFPGGEEGGWPACQEVRDVLEQRYQISGVIYPSDKAPRGICVSIWPIGEVLPESFFSPDSGPSDVSDADQENFTAEEVGREEEQDG